MKGDAGVDGSSCRLLHEKRSECESSYTEKDLPPSYPTKQKAA